MNKLDRLIFDDLILCFFGKQPDLDNDYWRPYWLNGDSYFPGHRDVFPENEHYAGLIEANYIKEIN